MITLDRFPRCSALTWCSLVALLPYKVECWKPQQMVPATQHLLQWMQQPTRLLGHVNTAAGCLFLHTFTLPPCPKPETLNPHTRALRQVQHAGDPIATFDLELNRTPVGIPRLDILWNRVTLGARSH